MAREGFNLHQMEERYSCLDEDTLAPRHPRSRSDQTSCLSLLTIFDDYAREDVSICNGH